MGPFTTSNGRVGIDLKPRGRYMSPKILSGPRDIQLDVIDVKR
jgi:hypothetical protein